MHPRRSYLLLAIALLAVHCLGCDERSQEPAAKAAASPVSSAAGEEQWSGDGVTLRVRYEVYPTTDDAFAAQRPGSIDAILATLNTPGQVAYVIAVEATAAAGKRLPRSFVTTFPLQAGGELQKAWGCAEASSESVCRAVVTVPPVASRPTTRPARAASSDGRGARRLER